MHIVIFGLTVSSSWGNGHATLWRGLLKALSNRGHTAKFYERDVSYYADTRDNWTPQPGISLRLYSSLDAIRAEALRDFDSADIGMFTSYCPDGPEVSFQSTSASTMIWFPGYSPNFVELVETCEFGGVWRSVEHRSSVSLSRTRGLSDSVS